MQTEADATFVGLLAGSSPSGPLARLVGAVASGDSAPVVAEPGPLVEAARVHELPEHGHHRGKIVLVAGVLGER